MGSRLPPRANRAERRKGESRTWVAISARISRAVRHSCNAAAERACACPPSRLVCCAIRLASTSAASRSIAVTSRRSPGFPGISVLWGHLVVSDRSQQREGLPDVQEESRARATPIGRFDQAARGLDRAAWLEILGAVAVRAARIASLSEHLVVGGRSVASARSEPREASRGGLAHGPPERPTGQTRVSPQVSGHGAKIGSSAG